MPADRAGKFDAEKVAKRLVEAYEGESVETLAVRQMFVAMLKDAFEAGRSAGIDEAHAAVMRLENTSRPREENEALADAMDVIGELLEKGRGE